MYERSIRLSNSDKKCEIVEERISGLNKHFTSSIYHSISRSLFQDHVLVFSFILCVGILRNEDKIDEDVWKFLLTGGHADGSTTTQHKQVCRIHYSENQIFCFLKSQILTCRIFFFRNKTFLFVKIERF